MVMPNFLIIGASKGGTTTLNYILDQHPEIFMCPEKEVGFFWVYGEKLDFRQPGSQKLIYRVVDDLDSYQNLFSRATHQKAIGEASVRYLSHPRSPELIHRFIPDAHLVAILRQPADRAFSSYLHNVRDGLEPCQSFSEAIAHERSGVRDNWHSLRYLEHGFYYEALQRYLKYFDRSQIFIRLFDDLHNQPSVLFRELFQFLEVDESFVPDLSHKHNVSGVIHNPWLRWLWTKTAKWRVYLRPIMSPRFRHQGSEWIYKNLDKQIISPEQRTELTDFYRQDILQLQDLLERDLSHWLVNPHP